MQIVAVDILGPLPETPTGNRYILVAMDYFTKWAKAYAIPNQEATTIANKLVNDMLLRFSPPEQLHSDQGRQFESTLIAEICKCLGIHKTRTTPYHPQSDGLVERFNRTLLNMLTTTMAGHPGTWEDHTQKVLLAYNTSTQSTTGFSPFFLMFGREARLPVDLIYGPTPTPPATVNTYAIDLSNTFVRPMHVPGDIHSLPITAKRITMIDGSTDNPMSPETLYGSTVQQCLLDPQ
jgi:hypothetical protein